MPFAATCMDLEITILSEINQRQILHFITYMWKFKKIQMNLYPKQIQFTLRCFSIAIPPQLFIALNFKRHLCEIKFCTTTL